MSRITVAMWITLFISAFMLSTCQVLAAEKENAFQMLKDAEAALNLAYLGIRELEEAGGNISSILHKLDSSAELLANAFNAYHVGDYDEAYRLGNASYQALEGVGTETSRLKAQAQQDYNDRLFMTASLSSVVLSVFFVVSLFVWRFIKKRYFRKVLEMKPEVVDVK
jgi:hypothetical protein